MSRWRSILLMLVMILVCIRPIMSELSAHVEPVEVEVNAFGNSNRNADSKGIHNEVPSNINKNSVNTAKKVEVEQQEQDIESQSKSHFVTLQHELKAVDELIELQRRKVETLAQLRTQALSVTDRRETADVNRAIDRQLDQLTTQYVEMLSGSRFDSHFVEYAHIQLYPDDVLVSAQMERLKQPHSNTNLVVLGYRSGEIVVYYSSPIPSELGRIDRLADNMELVSFQLDVVSDPPLLAVLYKAKEDPSVTTVAIYRLSLTPNDTMYTLVHKLYPRHTVTALSFARPSRRNVLTIACADGTLEFYATNGTIVHQIDVQAHQPIRTMTVRNNLLAFSNGTSTFLCTLSRQQQHPPSFRVCTGSTSMVTSIGFDPVDAETLFVGTADGEILVFSLAPSLGSEQNKCRLVHREIIKRSSSLSLQVLEGYVMATTNDRLTVFNVSRSSSTVNLKTVCSTPTSHRPPSPFSITQGTLGLTSSSPNSRLSFTLYHILLSSPSNADGIAGFHPYAIRVLWFICVIVVTVAITQWYLRRSNSNRETWSQQGATSRSSGMSTDQEAAKWISYLEQQRKNEMGNKSGDIADIRRLLSRQQGNERTKTFTRPYDSLSDGMRRKIDKARRETLECSFDDDQGKGFDI